MSTSKEVNYMDLNKQLQELPIIKARDETEEELDWANIRELIRTCLDLDEWKYSWHMPSLDYTDPEIKAQIKNIIKRKIQRREKELKMLKSCLKIINDFLKKDRRG